MTHYHGYSGNNYDRWVERNNSSSAIGKVQKQFWFTKSAVMRKLGKKEDEHIVASDAELDAKIELFKAIESSTKELQILLADYQNRICILAQEENSLGRLLKEYGKQENSRAGKMMLAVGKSLSYTAQQRVAMRNPLVRLFQEVDTFQTRAVEDTSLTVEEMEKLRTEYRGALMWMKNISQDFNPDHFQQLEKFREVQSLVKRKKSKFDQIKIKSLQKIELLAASRCNMFSHALILYQNNLITFSEKTAKTLNSVALNFKGYHPYKFQVIKELAEPQALLESEEIEENKHEVELDKDDKTFFGAEYHDEIIKDDAVNSKKEGYDKKLKSKVPVRKKLQNVPENLVNLLDDEEANESTKLLSFNEDAPSGESSGKNLHIKSNYVATIDLLSDDVPIDTNMSTQDLLKELFDSPIHETGMQSLPVFGSCNASQDDFSSQIFTFDLTSQDMNDKQSQMFLPSHLLDLGLDEAIYPTGYTSSHLPSNSLKPISKTMEDSHLTFQDVATTSYNTTSCTTTQMQKPSQPMKELHQQQILKQEGKKLDWYKVFQDIDPLADPANAIFGKRVDDKQC